MLITPRGPSIWNPFVYHFANHTLRGPYTLIRSFSCVDFIVSRISPPSDAFAIIPACCLRRSRLQSSEAFLLYIRTLLQQIIAVPTRPTATILILPGRPKSNRIVVSSNPLFSSLSPSTSLPTTPPPNQQNKPQYQRNRIKQKQHNRRRPHQCHNNILRRLPPPNLKSLHPRLQPPREIIQRGVMFCIVPARRISA